jgi:hypothetical protein
VNRHKRLRHSQRLYALDRVGLGPGRACSDPRRHLGIHWRRGRPIMIRTAGQILAEIAASEIGDDAS